jgi:hypothetical protein
MFTRFTIWQLLQLKPIADKPDEETKLKEISLEERKILRQEHLQRLKQYPDVIRKCLEHPTLTYLPDRGLLTFRGYDWRLDPVKWFYLSTPDFSSEDWGPELTMFRSHSSESNFWVHLEQLKEATNELLNEYDSAAPILSRNNQTFDNFWSTIKPKRTCWEDDYWSGRPSRTPSYPEPNMNEITPYYKGEIDSIIHEFDVITVDRQR